MKILTTAGDQLSDFVGVTENGVALDMLISELARRDLAILTSLQAKRARVAAGTVNLRGSRPVDGDRPRRRCPAIELTKELSWCILDKEPRRRTLWSAQGWIADLRRDGSR
jgi:hypothetical protein